MEHPPRYSPSEQTPTQLSSEGISPEKKGAIAKLTDKFYLLMATKINAGEAPLTVIPEQYMDAQGQFYNIQIRGDEEFTQRTNEALDILSENAPDFYSFVRQNIGMICQVERGSGMLANEPIPIFLAGKSVNVTKATTKRYAGNMAHEAWHTYAYRKWLRDHPDARGSLSTYEAWIKETVEQQEREANAVQYGAMVRLKASLIDLIDVKQSIETRYWEVPVDQRDW